MLYEIFRWIGTLTGYPFNWLFFKKKVYYENREIKKKKFKGGSLVIANHYCPLDYVVLAFVFFPRKLYVVASEYAFKNAFLRFGMKFFGGIEANRVTKSMSFISESVHEIKKGHPVLIFPEGHNTDDGTIKSFYPSYILIAHNAKAPIIPIVTDGKYSFFKRLHMIIGEEIFLSEYLSSNKITKEEINRLNEIIHSKMLDLRKELDLRIEEDKKGKK